MSASISDGGSNLPGDEVRQFILDCRKRHRRSNGWSAGLVLLGYVLLAGATVVGILKENGGRLAACGTFLAVVAIGLEQSFGFSEAADLQGMIAVEAEVLLSELNQPRRVRASAAYDRLNDLRLRLARVSRRARVDHLRQLLEQARPKPLPSSAPDRSVGGEPL